MTKPYEPNWADPRVQKRVESVLEWTRFMLNEVSPTPIHNDELAKIFGARSSELGAYLRHNLLIREGGYKPGVSSFGYKLNVASLKKLKAHIPQTCVHHIRIEQGSVNPLVVKHQAELDSLEFAYKVSSDRYWHPLQNLKRDTKAEFWKDRLPYDYDIEACAPTVLLQLSKRLQLPAIVTEEVADYLEHKTEWRERIMALTGLSYSDSKKLINSLFNGARLTPHWSCAAYRLLGYDRERMDALKSDPSVKHLRKQIRTIWTRISFHTGKNLSSGKAKWSIYFAWERQIIEAITDELKKLGIRYFTEHDGFRTNEPIDKKILMEAVKQKTKFELKLSGPGNED